MVGLWLGALGVKVYGLGFEVVGCLGGGCCYIISLLILRCYIHIYIYIISIYIYIILC